MNTVIFTDHCLSTLTLLEPQLVQCLILQVDLYRMQRPNPKINMVDGTMGVDYNFNLISTPESTPTHGNPMPESTLALYQFQLYPPVRDFGFGLWMVPTGIQYRAGILKNLWGLGTE
jgi:hypothetical protein